uniref:Uncharacterized protein n=1 Tax=Oryza punctata TaxID=4537 RepID=A0A0E0MHS7_ORYPU
MPSALDSLLGRLTTVLVSEAQLLGGVRGDVEFIKDEMESMNGLLLHLKEAQYRDHQVRAWMKQVAGLTRDCGCNVELYIHYVGGGGGGGGRVLAYLRRIPRLVRTIVVRHRIATRIRELKVRARDVGDRRLRYGVTVPPAPPDHLQNGGGDRSTADDMPSPQPGSGREEEEDLRRRALLYGEPVPLADTVDKGVDTVLEWLSGEATNIIFIAGGGSVGKTIIARRVYDHPSVVTSTRHRLWINLGGSRKKPSILAEEIKQKLLAAIGTTAIEMDLHEWYQARRLERGTSSSTDGDTASTEGNENRFLLLAIDAAPTEVPTRHYIRVLYEELFDDHPAASGTTVIVTTRYVDHVNGWRHILQLNNLDYSLPGFFEPRALALSKCEHAPLLPVLEECYPDVFTLHMFLHLLYVNPYRSKAEMGSLSKALAEHRNNTSRIMLMFCYNELPIKYKTCLQYLSIFPQGHNMLKVLDLEGCTDLENKHLNNICKILLLKYLSLRNTGVTQLPKKIDKLQCLETLDIRQTKIRAFATKSFFLPMLKHLLAGNKGSPSRSNNNSQGFEESLATVELPSGIRRMERLEILSHVDASNNVNDLINIGQLLQLRKLGVILDGKKAGSLALLFKQIEELHGCLCTLSIQINHPATSEDTVPETEQLAAMVSPPKLLQSLNINGITSGLPGWIIVLDQLTKITLSNTYLGEDAIRSLVVDGCDITNIDFVNIGAAPKLEMIIWYFDSVDVDILPLSGIEHLPKLKKLELNGDGDMAAMRRIREAHPNCQFSSTIQAINTKKLELTEVAASAS